MFYRRHTKQWHLVSATLLETTNDHVYKHDEETLHVERVCCTVCFMCTNTTRRLVECIPGQGIPEKVNNVELAISQCAFIYRLTVKSRVAVCCLCSYHQTLKSWVAVGWTCSHHRMCFFVAEGSIHD